MVQFPSGNWALDAALARALRKPLVLPGTGDCVAGYLYPTTNCVRQCVDFDSVGEFL